MDSVNRLFRLKDPYDCGGEQRTLFLSAVKENLIFLSENCSEYKEILNSFGFDINMLETEADLWKIPMFPSLYFKNNRIFAFDEKKLLIKASSSGTSGSKSLVGFDHKSFILGLKMVRGIFRYHKVLSPIPTNYIMLGYQTGRGFDLGAAKTAYGASFFAPALHREFALKLKGGEHVLNIDGITAALFSYEKVGLPVRFLGFPGYMYFLARELKRRGVTLRLNKRSKVLLGGGWKQFSDEEIPKEDFYRLIKETTGIEKDNILEFFSAVEHPVAYCKCKNGHFHVPVYSRVIIRDTATLKPVENGAAGILSFITPYVRSMPLISVSTDDIAVLHGDDCGCGIKTPYFELLGRAGAASIKTCAQGASALLKE